MTDKLTPQEAVEKIEIMVRYLQLLGKDEFITPLEPYPTIEREREYNLIFDHINKRRDFIQALQLILDIVERAGDVDRLAIKISEMIEKTTNDQEVAEVISHWILKGEEE